ncbi:MAG TPA: carboxylating nicotinate-nucleotide diphosphorylase [Lentimicrobium sp.]|nr:carboxylating nicotinate-nucleotide diphosphorylase [Lentimicrobium sp.]
MKQALSVDSIIEYALIEDIGNGDHTSQSTIPFTNTGRAHLLVKQEGILSGLEVAQKVFDRVDPSIKMSIFLEDGCKIVPGDIAFEVFGPSQSILKAERLVLNFMQRMSGIATTTSHYVSKIRDLNTKILDTRKTTPLLRELEKKAVIHGGGYNHRFGLYDMILIKDNHVDFAGGIEKAIVSVNKYLENKKLDLKIEIEVRNFNELKQVLELGGINRIMLDNYSVDDLRKAVKMIGGRYESEASGGINLETVRSVAETGVDYISIGALTHQIRSIDLSLKAF